MTSTAPDRQWVSEHGDKWAPDSEVLRVLVGSNVHGLAVDGTDDRDEMGIYVPPPNRRLGVSRITEKYVARTQPDGARSGPGDVDLTMYGLQHWAIHIVKGDPTMLLPIFTPETDVIFATDVGKRIRAEAPSLLSQAAGHRYLGYLHSQKERILGGGKRARVPDRPELVARYGFDVKYAAHALRLAVQGVELLTTGALTLPMPEPWRGTILGVRTGQYSLDNVLRMVDRQAEELVEVVNSSRSPLPKAPDWDKADALAAAWTLTAWRLG